ncbi:hypothetical protein FOZ63_026621, partial [Perkinsus olseni]
FERHREISTRWMRMELGIIRERWMAEQAAKIAELEARLSKMAAVGQQVDVLEMKQLEKSREAYKCIIRPPSANERRVQICVMQKEMVPRCVRLCAVGHLQSLRKRKLREVAAQHREDIERFKMDLKTWRDVDNAVRMISPHQDAHLPTPVCPPAPQPISTAPDGVIEQVIRRLQDEVGGSDVVGEAKRRRFCEDSRSAEEERDGEWLWKDAKQSPSGRYVDLHPALDRVIVSVVEEAITDSKDEEWILMEASVHSHENTYRKLAGSIHPAYQSPSVLLDCLVEQVGAGIRNEERAAPQTSDDGVQKGMEEEARKLSKYIKVTLSQDWGPSIAGEESESEGSDTNPYHDLQDAEAVLPSLDALGCQYRGVRMFGHESVAAVAKRIEECFRVPRASPVEGECVLTADQRRALRTKIIPFMPKRLGSASIERLLLLTEFAKLVDSVTPAKGGAVGNCTLASLVDRRVYEKIPMG